MFLFDVRRWPFVGALVPGVLSALAMLFAFPAFEVWWLVFLAPLPLILVAMWTGGAWRSGLGAGLASLVFWGWHERWIIDVSAPGLVPMMLYLAIYPGLFVAITARALRRWAWLPAWVVGPVVWVGLEVLRGQALWNGYPWYLLAHPTIEWPGLASIASIAGTYVVSAIVVLPAAAAADAVRSGATARGGRGARARRAGWRLGAVATLGIYAWAASAWSPDALGRARSDGSQAGAPVRFVVVQTSVAQDNKIAWEIEQRLADFAEFLAMTIEGAQVEPRPDVIVWPETMFPGYTLEPEAVEEQRRARLAYRELGIPVTVFYDRLLELQAQLGIPMIVGAIGADGHKVEIGPDGSVRSVSTEREYNSVFVVAEGRVGDLRYDKIHLTPFGEVMPYVSAWPWLERALLDFGAAGMTFHLSAGREPVRLEVALEGDEGGRGVLHMATPICFEVSNPGVVRRLVFEGRERRAGVIVQLTNDGWFGAWAGGRATHLQIARWRCVELGTPLVRAANTGISAAIDASGRMVREHAVPLEAGREVGPGPNPAGLLTADLRPASEGDRTLYVRVGEWAAWGLAGVGGLVFLGTFLPGGRTEGREERTTPEEPAGVEGLGADGQRKAGGERTGGKG